MNSYALQHTTAGKRHRFVLSTGETVIHETGSSVVILKTLRRIGLSIPAIMAGPSCWEDSYVVTWQASNNPSIQ
jgi:hypothetical protein